MMNRTPPFILHPSYFILRFHAPPPAFKVKAYQWVVADANTRYGWRPMTYDSKPIIGPSLKYENVYLAAGHGMLGISMAPATGRMIADLATSTAPFLPTSPYSATRFS